MKKLVTILLAACLCGLAFGCGNGADSKGCGDFHTWQEATCTAPKTCSVCGATEGEPLGHDLTEANYQSPAICRICNEAVGEKLPASLENRGIAFAEPNVDYELSTPCKNSDLMTSGKVRFENYRIVDSDKTHEAKEGYEWRIVNIHYIFSDENAHVYGYTFGSNNLDYYTDRFETQKKDGNSISIVHYNGEKYAVDFRYAELANSWEDDSANIILEVAVNVPKDYDGVIVTANKPGKRINNVEDLKEINAHFFRLA